MRLRPLLLLAIVGPGLAGQAPIGGAAAAERADCPRPVGLAEPLPCGDAELAAVEAQVASAVGGAEAKLSAPGRARLHTDQAAWRIYLTALCLGAPEPGGGATADCLKQEYDVRRAQLSRAVETLGGLVLLRNERFAARPPRIDEDAAHPVLTDIAWPVIDRAESSAQRRWNEAMTKAAELLSTPLDPQQPDTDIAVDYRVDYVGAELIQTVFSRDLYIHGAAHGDDTTIISLFLLQPGRALAAEDVFDTAKPWRPALAALVHEALEAQARDGAWRLWPAEPGDLADLAAEPTRWLLDRTGLSVHFDPYDVADYAAGPLDVAIPWTVLAPYLRPDPPLHLPPG